MYPPFALRRPKFSRVVAHTFNSCAWEAKADGSLEFKANLVTERLPRQSNLQREILKNKQGRGDPKITKLRLCSRIITNLSLRISSAQDAMTRYIINLSGALKEGREGTAMQSGYWSTPLTVHQELIHPRKPRRAESLYKKI